MSLGPVDTPPVESPSAAMLRGRVVEVRVVQCGQDEVDTAACVGDDSVGVMTTPPAQLPHSAAKTIVITIDGPAATGKTSVAHEVARRLGFEFLDTGAMYRAAALIALRSSLVSPQRAIDPAQHDAIVRAVDRVSMAFDWKSDPPALLCDGESVMERIRDDDVTGVVSPVAGIAALRRTMVAKQRQIAEAHPRLVTEGRDQGAIVFPRAAVKFFLDADPLVRARRRRDQMIARRNKAGGSESVAGLSTIAEGLLERDAADTAEGRLLRPSDAQIVDTTDLGFQDVVEELVRRAKLAIAGRG